MPRTIVPELEARVITEPLYSASIRRCPSIRVTGSIVMADGGYRTI
jgi:hypothetical protein